MTSWQIRKVFSLKISKHQRRAWFESLHEIWNPFTCQKVSRKKRPCLRPGAPYQILPSARHREGAEGRGSFGGIFIFSQFSGQIYSAGIWSSTEAEYLMGGSSRLIGLGALDLSALSQQHLDTTVAVPYENDGI